jgi:serine/threonine protein kinase/AmiR/NasT family two-component response regulator
VSNEENFTARLPESSQSKSSILTHIRHELRTPMNAIIGYSEMLLDDATDLELHRLVPDLQQMLAAAKQLLKLINDILAPAKLEVRKADLQIDSLGGEICNQLQGPADAVLAYAERLMSAAEEQAQPQMLADLNNIRIAARKLLAFIADVTYLATPAEPPAAPAPAAPAAASPVISATKVEPAGKPLAPFQKAELGSILVVDDNEMNRDILSRCLVRQGHIVATAASGRDALMALNQHHFDLVLLDIMMPEMSGYEVLQHLQADASLRAIPVIFVSAMDATADKVKAFKSGGVDYVTKPFQAEEVAARVENQLKIARLQKALERQNQELIKSNEELTRAQKRTEMVFSAFAEVLPGTVLEGKYRLEQKLGAGGFGAVYRATHLGLHKPVAVKIFRPMEGNDSREGLERFRLEGISTSRVIHPNAVTVFDSGISAGGMAYLVMELLQGHTLADELKVNPVLSPARCLNILIPICEALAAAHEIGIVHRDIKPDNIFLQQTKEGEVVKVVDFGIAKNLAPASDLANQVMTIAGGIIGTPAYIAPERFEGLPYDGRTDIYSLGIMLYQMLCGHVPFRSAEGGAYAVAVMHLMKEPTPPRELNPNIPPALESIVMQTLVKEPGKRPTASEMVKQAKALCAIDALSMRGDETSGTLSPTTPTAPFPEKPMAGESSHDDMEAGSSANENDIKRTS